MLNSATYAIVSPDAAFVAAMVLEDGAYNVWVRDAAGGTPRQATAFRSAELRMIDWCMDSRTVICSTDPQADENLQLLAVSVADGATRLLSEPGYQTRLLEMDRDCPDHIAGSANDRDAAIFDVYRVDIRTGRREVLLCNDQDQIDFVVDRSLRVRAASRLDEVGNRIVSLYRDQAVFHTFEIAAEDAMTSWLRAPVDKEGRFCPFINSAGRDTSRLDSLDLATGEIVSTDHGRPGVDIAWFSAPPSSGLPDCYCVEREKLAWFAIAPELQEPLADLERRLGCFEIQSRSDLDCLWTVKRRSSGHFPAYYLYAPRSGTLSLFGEYRPKDEPEPLSRTYPLVLKSRDGLDLVSYLTVPHADDRSSDDGVVSTARPLPMVVAVHGGPWCRDGYYYSSQDQWLARLGCAVLRVNFRGSVGFGKRFTNLANHEYGGRVTDDIVDAFREIADRQLCDPRRTAIMGESFGGFQVLSCLTRYPRTFACGIDLYGMSNLATLISNAPPQWRRAIKGLWADRMGDPTTKEGRKLLAAHSPLLKADLIERPLLIFHGARDRRVRESESRKIAKKLESPGAPVVYGRFRNEGHGFYEADNRKTFKDVVAAFLSRWIGVPDEPPPIEKNPNFRFVCGGELMETWQVGLPPLAPASSDWPQLEGNRSI